MYMHDVGGPWGSPDRQVERERPCTYCGSPADGNVPVCRDCWEKLQPCQVCGLGHVPYQLHGVFAETCDPEDASFFRMEDGCPSCHPDSWKAVVSVEDCVRILSGNPMWRDYPEWED